MERIVIYPGTFDPITKGHIGVIETACDLFDRVYVALLCNTSKIPVFNLAERKEMIKLAIENNYFKNVRVRDYDELTVDFAQQVEAIAIIRGLRLTTDYEAELNIALNNRKLNSQIATVLIPPRQEHIHISSSAVRELIRFEQCDNLWQYLDPSTVKFLTERTIK